MPKVIFKSGKNVEEEEVAAGARLMEVAQEKGWPVLFACEDGVCGTCLIKISKGMENLSPMEEKEKSTLMAMGMDPKKHRLCCQCKVNGDVTIEQ